MCRAPCTGPTDHSPFVPAPPAVSMTPREGTALHNLGGPPHADIIAFYNQVRTCVCACACVHTALRRGSCPAMFLPRMAALCVPGLEPPQPAGPRAAFGLRCSLSAAGYASPTTRPTPLDSPALPALPQVFLPHTRPFLLRLAESRSLLAQPPASVLPNLLAMHGQQAQQPVDGATPPPPSLQLRGVMPVSLQHTPLRPGAPGGAWPSPAPPPAQQAWGPAGTPSRGGAGAARTLQLRSPGAWRISGGQMTPVPPNSQLPALEAAFSPGGRHAGFLHGAPPLSTAAIHSMFGLPGGAPAPAAVALPVAALPAAAAAPPGQPPPLVSDAAVHAMFASAEAAAATAAAAAAAGGAGVQPQREAASEEADAEELRQLSALPSESLPLLAAAAVVAEEIEQREREVAEAFSRRAAQLAGVHLVPALPPVAAPQQPEQPEQPEQQPEQQQQPAATQAPDPSAAAAAADGQPTQLQEPEAPQQLPRLSPARQARRILSLQPAAVQ